MAQPIYCDWEGCDEPADVMVSQLANGDTLAWCNPHWGQVLLAMAAELEPGQELPGPAARQESDEDDGRDRDDEDADDAEAIARLEATGRARTADSTPDGSEAPQEESAPPAGAQEPVEPTNVVARGTSRSRRRHEAKKRDKARAAEPEPEPAE